MALPEELTEELMQFYDHLTSWEHSTIRASDLAVSEAHAIEALGHYGPMNMKQLAQRLGVTTGTVTVTVDRLERKGYGKREVDPEDRRVNWIRLTEKGRAEYEEHHACHRALTQHITRVLTRQEAGQLLCLLRKLNAEAFFAQKTDRNGGEGR